jgi:outer membrane protein assembly factor BamE (lipoprotein component of BamABCDE complex)
VLGGGSSKFKEIKDGMTVKEVTDKLGEPHSGSTQNVAQWYYPKMTQSEAASGGGGKLKESLTVTFIDGKVKGVLHIDAKEIEKQFKGAFK